MVRVEGFQVDVFSSCGHHDSTEMNRAVIAQSVHALPAKLTGAGGMQCSRCTITIDFVVQYTESRQQETRAPTAREKRQGLEN